MMGVVADLEKLCPDVPRSYLEQADRWGVNLQGKPELVRTAELARVLWKADGGNDASAGSARRARPMPGSDLLLEAIREDMEATREKIFGSSAPPFDNYRAAVEWLESHLAAPVTKRQKQAMDDLQRHAERVNREEGVPVVVDFKLGTIDYVAPGKPKPKEAVPSVPVEPGSPLVTLKRFLAPAELATGLSEPELVIYALTPARPFFRRYRLRKHTQPSQIGDVVHWTVLIYAPDITWQEFREIHRELADQRRGRKKLRSLDDQIIRRVQSELGGLPKRGSGRRTAYWEEFRARCERLGLVLSRAAAQKRCQRLGTSRR